MALKSAGTLVLRIQFWASSNISLKSLEIFSLYQNLKLNFRFLSSDKASLILFNPDVILFTPLCTDINECEQFGICYSQCINFYGIYKCGCPTHFSRTDPYGKGRDQNFTCLANGKNLLLSMHRSVSAPVDKEYSCRLVRFSYRVIVDLSGQQMNYTIHKGNTYTFSLFRG